MNDHIRFRGFHRISVLRACVRYAVSELLHRRAVTSLCLTASTICAGLLWQLGSIAGGINDSRNQQLESEDPTAVRIRVRDATDPRQQLDERRMRQLLELPWVAGGGNLIDVHVYASLNDTREQLIPAEGAVAPATTRRSLAWGSSRIGDGEVVITLALLESLGGTLTAQGPSPAMLHVRLARTVSGVHQKHAEDLTIVGVSRRQRDGNRIDITANLACRLDRWCQGEHVAGLPGDSRGLGIKRIRSADVSVAAVHLDRFRRHAAALGLAVTAQGGGTLRVARGDGKPMTDAELIDVELLQPMVLGLRPIESSPAMLDRKHELQVEASEVPQSDRRRLQPGELLLPRNCVPELRARAQVELEFTDRNETTCALRFRVIGETDGAAAVVHVDDLRQVAAWKQGRLLHDPARGFYQAQRSTTRSGQLRALLYAKSLADIEPLVSCLRTEFGLDTRDQLDLYQGVRSFGNFIALLVAAIVGSSLLLGVTMITGMNAQKLQASEGEIRLLRVLAVPARRIVAIYGMQGLIVGGIALAIAATVQASLSIPIRSAVARAFGCDVNAVLKTGLFGPPALIATVIVVSLGCAVAGVVVPALRMTQRI